MDVELVKILDNGDIGKEHVVLNVSKSTDIGKYILFDTTYNTNGNVSNKLRHSYWFPDKEIHSGDVIWFYTKKGKKETRNVSGKTVHLFYWGLDETVWNEDGDCAVLVKIADWNHIRVSSND